MTDSGSATTTLMMRYYDKFLVAQRLYAKLCHDDAETANNRLKLDACRAWSQFATKKNDLQRKVTRFTNTETANFRQERFACQVWRKFTMEKIVLRQKTSIMHMKSALLKMKNAWNRWCNVIRQTRMCAADAHMARNMQEGPLYPDHRECFTPRFQPGLACNSTAPGAPSSMASCSHQDFRQSLFPTHEDEEARARAECELDHVLALSLEESSPDDSHTWKMQGGRMTDREIGRRYRESAETRRSDM